MTHTHGSPGHANGLVVSTPEDVPGAANSRPDGSRRPELDTSLPEKLDDLIHQKYVGGGKNSALTNSEADPEMGSTLTESHYIDFAKGDTRNPVNFSNSKKWAITLMATGLTILASIAAGSYNLGFPSMIRDLHCSEFQATLGLSVFPLGFGLVPLVTASFSEEFGRQPLYIGSTIGFLLMYLLIALSRNIQTVIIARFFQGAFGSTGATMVGGTIADIWMPHERGLPMSIFSVGVIGGMGLGPMAAGWIELNQELEWRWIQWIQFIICAVYLLFVPVVMTETRSVILLTRIAKKLRKETGDNRYRARVEDERASLRALIYISFTRPIYLLLTEPIVIAFSLWVGFAWGVTYCVIESISSVLHTLHNFNPGQIGTAFLTMVIGTLLGFFSHMYQEKLYHKYFPKRGLEARLYSACFAAIILPAGMFIYAWSTFPWVHWIALMIGIVIFMWATFLIYLTVFTYLADCYGPFASSALAGQSLFRNLMATAFPLFTQQMFSALSYKWANTLFACVATIMIPIPFVLYIYGPTIRARSQFSRAVMAIHPN